MYRYSGKLRLSGSVMHEVYKENMSAAEVMILRRLHGEDALVDLVEHGNDRSPHAAEREKLKQIYCGSGQNRTRIDFERLFGADHMDLPARLPQVKEEDDELKNSFTRPKTDVDTNDVDIGQLAG